MVCLLNRAFGPKPVTEISGATESTIKDILLDTPLWLPALSLARADTPVGP